MVPQVSVEEMALEERKFLHDLSNHLVISQGMTNIVLKNLKELPGIDPKIVDKQEKALNAINAQIKLIKERRLVLHERS